MPATPTCDTLIRGASLLDGSGAPAERLDLAITGDRIHSIGANLRLETATVVEADGLCLAPGFIDTHTHDDLAVLRDPAMAPKITQGITTVVVGNCGISASPVTLRGAVPDPMNLLGAAAEFRYPTFAAYQEAVRAARPAVNVAALIGHTALRNNHMDRLDRAATSEEAAAMRAQLEEALHNGALGLSSGLAYLSANAASTEELLALARPLGVVGGIYATHMRSESDAILDAMEEAFTIGRETGAPVIISHLKCAGIDQWGRSEEVLHKLDAARLSQPVGCDCYPYAAGSSTLDLRQVDERVTITVTWSDPHPEAAGRALAEVAAQWSLSQIETAQRLQPAGAIYHSISEDDMRRILGHPATMIGSDGLPCDPRPHPRLWGTFPRVLGRYAREQKLFSLAEAIRKMTAMPAQRFGLEARGCLREGNFADLVLFDPQRILDRATFADPIQHSEGIVAVWVNGVLSCTSENPASGRSGQFLRRGRTKWIQ
ncbi:MAG TPA: D-aminoacylase [Acidobacteriaceae bacterium]|nr:D-aminoacylase [Acidobacteriaceae bacterium]